MRGSKTKVICRLRQYLTDEYERNVFLNYLFRVLMLVFAFWGTRYTLGYLGVSLYGLWATITSVVSWMNQGDLGIGNGLRNELAKAYAVGDEEKQKRLIHTGIVALARVSVILLFLMVIVCEILFKTNVLQDVIRFPMYITTVFFSLNLLLSISHSIVLAYQKSWLTSFVLCLSQLLSVICILILKQIGNGPDLVLFSVVNGICITLPNIFLIVLIKVKKIGAAYDYKAQKYDRDCRRGIMNVGIQFFILQLCTIILFATDNLIINKLFSSEMVTKYSIITKVYDTGYSIFAICLTGFWSAVTYYIAKGSYEWIRKQIKKLLVFLAVFAVGVVAVSLLFNPIIRLWLGDEAQYYENELIALFGIYCVINAFLNIFVFVINGMGKIKVQICLAIGEAIINIPLSVFFAQNCNMGIFGVKLATLICISISSIIIPIQVFRNMRNEEQTLEDKQQFVEK